MRRPELKQPAFSQSPGNLKSMDFWNLRDDFERLLNQMSQEGSLEITPQGKYRPRLYAARYGQPWYFIRLDTEQDCLLYFDICFSRLGFIHSYCQDCYKTVIVTHPDPQKQRVIDLFRLRDKMRVWNLPSKLGVDIRTYTPNRYVAFIYGRGLEEGINYWKFASESLPKAKVILKRGCTEFENRFPHSSTWKVTEEQKKLEALVDMYLETGDKMGRIVNRSLGDASTFRFWIDYAFGIGDPTWRDALVYEGYEAPDGPLYPPPDTYHQRLNDGNTNKKRT